jgi:hypothetical protein
VLKGKKDIFKIENIQSYIISKIVLKGLIFIYSLYYRWEILTDFADYKSTIETMLVIFTGGV